MGSLNEIEVENRECTADEPMEAVDLVKTEVVPNCGSARSSTNFNISRLSSPLKFLFTMSSTPIKHPEVKSQVETSNNYDLNENSTNKSDENQNFQQTASNHPPIVRSPITSCSTAQNLASSNLLCHSSCVDNSSANNETAERNPFFSYDHWGNIMFMDTSSPPLECIDQMLNNFHYDPDRPKCTGFVKQPEKINPFTGQTTVSKAPLFRSGSSDVIFHNATPASSITGNIPNCLQAQVLDTGIDNPALSSSTVKNDSNFPGSEIVSTRNLCTALDQNKLSKSSTVENVQNFYQSGVLNDSIHDTALNSSVVENTPNSLQSRVPIYSVHHGTQNSPVLEIPPNLLQSQVLYTNVHHATQNSPVLEIPPTLLQSRVLDTSVHHATQNSEQNSSIMKNPPNLPQSTLRTVDIMENSLRRSLGKHSQTATRRSKPGMPGPSRIPRHVKSISKIPKSRTIARRTSVKLSTMNQSRPGSHSSATTAGVLKQFTNKQILPRQSLAPKRLRSPTNIHLTGTTAQNTSLRPSISRPVTRKSVASKFYEKNNASSIKKHSCCDVLKPSTSRMYNSVNKSLAPRVAGKNASQSGGANTFIPSSIMLRSKVAIKKPPAAGQYGGNSKPSVASTLGTSTNPTPELLAISEEGS